MLHGGQRFTTGQANIPHVLTSKMPTPVRTAMCSLTMPQPIDAGYSTGMSSR